MKIAIAGLCLVVASLASAAESMPAFGSFSFAQLRRSKTGIEAPRARLGDVLTSFHMVAQAEKDSLFGYADNEADAAEAISYWTGVLKAAGIPTGSPTYANGAYHIPYKNADGREIRDFLADTRQFPPKDETGLRRNMAFATDVLNKGGRNALATRVLEIEGILPTYSILYLTQPDALPEHETRLRVLKAGDDVEFDLFRRAGIDVIQTPAPWMMVYVGPEVGFVTLAARTPEELDAKVVKRREFLAGEGKKLIAERRGPLGAALYFFQ